MKAWLMELFGHNGRDVTPEERMSRNEVAELRRDWNEQRRQSVRVERRLEPWLAEVEEAERVVEGHRGRKR